MNSRSLIIDKNTGLKSFEQLQFLPIPQRNVTLLIVYCRLLMAGEDMKTAKFNAKVSS